jgi:hypothetical protein
MIEHVDSYKTSWGSDIAPYIQKRIIKRIHIKDDMNQIIEEELMDILDTGSDRYDEAHEIYSRCEELYNQHIQQTQ